jgi:uncharacterized SAM-binding protein YcdF (DUF218 family)
MRRLGRAIALVLALALLYVLVTLGQVLAATRHDDRTRADAIIVLGAAQYDGQPSPALRNRLDHAAALYGDDLAPVIWVTGGRQPGDRFSEASASSQYLIRQGIPNDAVQLEIHGGNSYESLAATARYLRSRDQRDVLLVSDAWHTYRVTAIAREVGLRPRVSPSSPARLSGVGLRRLGREVTAVALGRFVGYRRLTGIGIRWGPPE